jgi:hypothetical protein
MTAAFPWSRSATLALAISFACLPACGSDGTDGQLSEPGQVDSSSARVRVVHASPDAPAVDIYAEGSASPLIQALAYGGSSPYLELSPGEYTLLIRAAGAAADSPPVYSTGPVQLGAGAEVTAIAAGLLGGTGDTGFRVLLQQEQFTAPAAGKAVVRVVHASADAPTVAIDVGDDGSAELEGLARFADTGASGVELPAGAALQIAIWAGQPAQRVTAFTTPALPDGAELFVIATGLLAQLPRESTAFSLLAVGPSGSIGFIQQNPTVYALHASVDAPAVDIYAGGTRLVQDLAFGELSQPVQVPPGAYELAFRAAGSMGDPAATVATPALTAGQRYLAVATGLLHGTGPAFQLVAVADSLAVDPGSARLGVVHASPDAPAVDIGTVSGTQLDAPALVANLAFGESSMADGLSVPAADLGIGVAAAGSATPVARFAVTTAPGLRAIAVAAGALAGGALPPFRLFLVVTSSWPWSLLEVAPSH